MKKKSILQDTASFIDVPQKERYYIKSAEEVLKKIDSTDKGLNGEEVIKRQTSGGKNRLKEGKKKSLIMRFLGQLVDPMIIILIVAAAISGAMSIIEGHFEADVVIIMAVVLINAVLGVYQESKAEKAIEALQKMSAATSKVIRDGRLVVVKSEDLVVGDIVVLEAGDSVPADGRIIECASLKIEEAALTGESVPVNKIADTIELKQGEADITLGDRKNMVYMGSTVVYGRGIVVITAIGMDTEMGKIADALAKAEQGQTPLQIRLNQLSKTLTWLVLGVCAVVFGVQLLRNGVGVDNILNSFMIAVSLAVAAIPEGLAAVVTVVLSIGVTNMSKRSAIIRRLTAVETLGCAQIICSDKTGTLTQNKMTVVDYFGDDEKLIATAMALCNDAEIEDGEVVGEPTEAALVGWADKIGLNKNDLKAQYIRFGEAPFDSQRKMMSTVHQNNNQIVQFTKGAPDEMLKKCTHYYLNGKIVEITEELRAKVLQANKAMADKALRVLAAAERIYQDKPQSFESENLEEKLVFLGLCGMIDPVRPEVKDAIALCREAGIRPIMITGDHVDTAVAIATELGILNENTKALTGAELNQMNDEEFEKVFMDVSVYARVQPEHKTRIVNAWKKFGFITAMTGDGVNDAPSIKSADIGVGMGITGTDVTKNVADMVLSDDNFATIVGAVEEGRRIYDNIRKAIQFLLSANISEVLSIFISTLMGFTILQPVHLLWINLVTDCFPALALGMEKAEKDIMQRKPRSAKAGIFSDGMGLAIGLEGAALTILILASYFIGSYMEFGYLSFNQSGEGMTMAFLTMSMTEIFHCFNMRSTTQSLFRQKGQNKMLLIAAVVSLVATTLVCEVPFLMNAFNLTHVSWVEYGIAIGVGFIIIPVVEISKIFKRRKEKRLNAKI